MLRWSVQFSLSSQLASSLLLNTQSMEQLGSLGACPPGNFEKLALPRLHLVHFLIIYLVTGKQLSTISTILGYSYYSYSLHSFFMIFGLFMISEGYFGIFPIGKPRRCKGLVHTPTSNQSVFLLPSC